MGGKNIESITATIKESVEQQMQSRDEILMQLKKCSEIPRDYNLDSQSLKVALEYRRLLFRILNLYPPYSFQK